MQNNNQAVTLETALLAVLGGSPQVLTETLYGMYKADQALPATYRIITTAFGLKQLETMNFFGEQGVVAQFYRDYHLPVVPLEQTHIILITNEQGEVLNDTRLESDHKALADTIIGQVRALTQAEQVVKIPLSEFPDEVITQNKKQIELLLEKQYSHIAGYKSTTYTTTKKQQCVTIKYDRYLVHASIAGGRKTMTFLLGYAMSLFARKQDVLSHVLVDQQVENCRHFFYPSAQQNIQDISYQGAALNIDFSQVSVTLSEIPIVRMAANMPQHILNMSLGYNETVELFELEKVPASLEFDLEMKESSTGKFYFDAIMSGKAVELDLKSATYLYAWLQIDQPITADDTSRLPLLKVSSYASLISGTQQNFEDAIEALQYFDDNDDVLSAYSEKDILGKFNLSTKDYDATLQDYINKLIKNPALYTEFGGWFGKDSDHKKHIKPLLNKYLGDNVAARYLPQEVDKLDSGGTKGISLLKMTIARENIKIINPLS